MVISQVRGFFGNLWKYVTTIGLGEILPPAIASTLVWARDTIPRGLGFADRNGHLTGVFALTIVMIVASATLLTWLAVAYFLVGLPIALFRFVPAVDDRWPIDEGSWPFWKVRESGFNA